MSNHFTVRLRVRYAECDPQNVVFNSRYVEYIDVAMTEYYREVLGGYEKLVEAGIETQVISVQIDWKSSARCDDVLDLVIGAPQFGNTSVAFDVLIQNFKTQQVVAETRIVYVTVDGQSFTKMSTPQAIRDKLQAGFSGTVIDLSGVKSP